MSRLRPRTKNARKRVRDLRSQWGSPAYRALFRQLSCFLTGDPAEPSHLKTRGSGGRYYSILPMSWEVHRRWEENEPSMIEHAEREDWFGWAAWIAGQAEEAGLIADPLPPEGRPPAVEPPRRLRGEVQFWIRHLSDAPKYPSEYTEEYVTKYKL